MNFDTLVKSCALYFFFFPLQRHSTAPYRAPELWDVPSSCTIDAKVDIWAAGCVLYYLLVGETPFERIANEAGGSMMLAIVK
jgi:serine/threonine kinase 16